MKLRDSQFIHAGAVLSLALLYALSGPRTLPEADSGEFAAIAVRGGIAHPPGYPLLAIVLQAFAPLGALLGLTPALTLSSILFACVAAWLIARTAIARGAGATAAWTATLAVFLSTNVWRNATSFEPRALNLLLAAGVLASCQRLSQSAGRDARAPLIATGLLFGLGLCNHHSLFMLAPLPAALLFAQPRELLVRGLWLALGFALGATPLLLFLFLRTQSGWIWGDWDPFLPRLVTHLLRLEYGTFALTANTKGHVGYGLSRMFGTLPAVLSFAFFALLVLGVGLSVRRWLAQRAGTRDVYALGSALAFATSGVLFPMLFRHEGTGMDHVNADRMLGLPMLLLVSPLAAALTALQARLRAAHAPVCGLLLLAHAALQWPQAARVDHRFFEDHMRNVFAIAERGAVIMSASDAGFSGGLYGRYVLGRSDVTIVFSGMNYAWYAELMRAEIAAGATLTSRPLYWLERPVSSPQIRPPTYPIGPLLRVVQPGETMPSPVELFARNEALFAGMRLPSREQLARLDAWEASELVNYSRVWAEIGARLARQGDHELAARAFRYRDAFTHESR
jgi:hypothetical protein